MDSSPEIVQNVLNATRGLVDTKDEPDTFTTQDGVVLHLRSVAPMLINDAQRRVKEPKIPLVKNLDKGDDVWEENPNDPSYLRAVEEHRQTLGELTNSLLIMRGTEVVSVPDGFPKLEDKAWSEDIEEFTGIQVPASGRRRYYCWIKYCVLSSMSDFMTLLRKVSSMGGITLEADVAQAMDDFRNNKTGDTPEGIHIVEASGLGDQN